MRKVYWYLSAYSRKHGWLVILSVVFAIVIFSLTIPGIARLIDQKSTEYIGLVGTPTLTTLPLQIQDKMSMGLTKLQEDGSVIPALAERWTTENDGLTYRFVLRQDIKWQDGTPVTTSDIKYQFNDVEMITTPQDIVFKLKDVYVPFPTVVSRPVFKEATQRYYLFFNRLTLIGTGEFRLTDYETQSQRLTELTIESSTQRLVYRFYLTEEDAILAFKHGKVDHLPELSDIKDLGTWPTVEVQTHLQPHRYLAVFFNTPLYDKTIRQALSYGLQKPTDTTRAIGPISPTSWAYFEGSKTYQYDIDRAVERLMEKPDGLPETGIEIELTTTPSFENEANAIKEQWEHLGNQAYEFCQQASDIKDKAVCERVKIKVSVRIAPFPDVNNFQALLIGQESPPDPDQYDLWHSSRSSNFSKFSNARIDNLLEKGRKTADRNERLAIYQEFQQFFLEDAPAIFIRYLDSYEVKRK